MMKQIDDEKNLRREFIEDLGVALALIKLLINVMFSLSKVLSGKR